MKTDQEYILANGELEIVGRIRDASNASLLAKSRLNDEEVACIYKPIIGEKPLWDFTDGNLASREVASYLISEWGGWNRVPTTLLRDGPFGLGAVQLWIDIDHSIDLETYFRERDPQLRSLALLDAVINNTDRKIGHLLVDKEGHLFGCDHGVTFHVDDKLRTVLWQYAGDTLEVLEVNQLQELSVEIDKRSDILKNLITAEEYLALNTRIERLLSEGRFPYPSEDWPAIPWPPF